MRLLLLLSLALSACVHDEPVPGPVPQECAAALAHAKKLDPSVAVDLVPFCCTDQDPLPLPNPATASVRADFGGLHQAVPKPIAYDDNPPASGTHRDDWAKWGTYAFLPPQRWLHNLEHGGVALLYHPCAPKEVVERLLAYARACPADESGPFRWVLTPYPGLPSVVAVVTWRVRYLGPDADIGAIERFVDQHYRRAPEDFGFEGGYDLLWLGR